MLAESASQILHALAGSPAFEGASDVSTDVTPPCWLCGSRMLRGIPCDKWQGALFTDQNKARCQHATHVCEACAWACSWVVPPGHPPPPPGKKGVNLRLFAHMWGERRGYSYHTKGDKPGILAWLRDLPVGERWFGAILDTGQKHVIPWTPVNHGGRGGMVRFEERDLYISGREDWGAVDDAVELLSQGVTKDELGHGQYSARSYKEVGLKPIQDFERRHGKHRGTAWFELVIWLSQRDEVEYENRRREARGAAKQDRGRVAGDAGGVLSKRGERAEALEPATGPNAHGSENKRDGTGLGNDDVQEPSAADRKQLALF